MGCGQSRSLTEGVWQAGDPPSGCLTVACHAYTGRVDVLGLGQEDAQRVSGRAITRYGSHDDTTWVTMMSRRSQSKRYQETLVWAQLKRVSTNNG